MSRPLQDILVRDVHLTALYIENEEKSMNVESLAINPIVRPQGSTEIPSLSHQVPTAIPAPAQPDAKTAMVAQGVLISAVHWEDAVTTVQRMFGLNDVSFETSDRRPYTVNYGPHEDPRPHRITFHDTRGVINPTETPDIDSNGRPYKFTLGLDGRLWQVIYLDNEEHPSRELEAAKTAVVAGAIISAAPGYLSPDGVQRDSTGRPYTIEFGYDGKPLSVVYHDSQPSLNGVCRDSNGRPYKISAFDSSGKPAVITYLDTQSVDPNPLPEENVPN